MDTKLSCIPEGVTDASCQHLREGMAEFVCRSKPFPSKWMWLADPNSHDYARVVCEGFTITVLIRNYNVPKSLGRKTRGLGERNVSVISEMMVELPT